MAYAELHCRSYYSFLGGASSPAELVARAAALGYARIAITDIDGVHGAVQAYLAARDAGIQVGVGSEVTVLDDLAVTSPSAPKLGARLVLLAQSGAGYANLCRLLTLGRTRCEKGSSWVKWEEFAAHATGLAVLSGGRGGPIDSAWRRGHLPAAVQWAARLRDAFPGRAHIELTHHLAPGDDRKLRDLSQLAAGAGLPAVWSQDARFADASARRLYDVQTCIREKTTLAAAGSRLAINGERCLQPPAELERRFGGDKNAARAMKCAAELADSLDFSLAELRYRFPHFDLPDGETPFSYLRALTAEGAKDRYSPQNSRAAAQIARELAVVDKLNLAGYFLIVWDIVRFCRQAGILCQGRGSAANSAVCYALGITAVDPVAMNLLFERFLSEDRDEMPDIDVDIDSGRREEVIQYVYRRFGRDRVAMACNVNTYHARSAVRDVGKAFGLSLEQVDRAAKALDRHTLEASPQNTSSATYRGVPSFAALPADAKARWRAETGLDIEDPLVAQTFDLALAFESLPRHLGIHSGGLVITAGPISEVVPIENATMAQRTVVQWDKDDLAALGIIKIDLLGLGILSALSDTVRQVERFEGKTIELAKLPMDDAAVYEMTCRADTVGVFQIESRAQMNMLPRLRPRTFYDLVIQVAIIRPGPIQGDMIHPYLRRRAGLEPVIFAHPALKPVLGRTLGVPLFQEQGMKLAVACAGFTAGEADELRRAMGHKRSHAKMARLQERLRDGMTANGISAELAERIYQQLCAFANYGFPESHAASFALLVYASAYLKHHHPEAFLAGLLNAQPMGFYSPNSLIHDARRHGVEVLSPCALKSEWATSLEPQEGRRPAVRLGIKELTGAGEKHRETFARERARAPFASLRDFAHRAGLPRAVLARFASADGFRCYGLERRQALWDVAALPANLGSAPLLDGLEEGEAGGEAPLRPMSASEKLAADFRGLGVSVEQHPLALLRPALSARGMVSAAVLNRETQNRRRIAIGGMVTTRQRPPSAKGMMFLTLEDESGIANAVLTPSICERYRPLARGALFLIARGVVEREGEVVNLRVETLEALPWAPGAAPSASRGQKPPAAPPAQKSLPGLRSRDFR